MTDNRINWEEFKENITNLFAYKPAIGDTGITVEITREYAEKIGAAYNEFVNPEVNIIITDKQKKLVSDWNPVHELLNIFSISIVIISNSV